MSVLVYLWINPVHVVKTVYLLTDIHQEAGDFWSFSCGLWQSLLVSLLASYFSTRSFSNVYWNSKCFTRAKGHGWWCFLQLLCHFSSFLSYIMAFWVLVIVHFPSIKYQLTWGMRIRPSWKLQH